MAITSSYKYLPLFSIHTAQYITVLSELPLSLAFESACLYFPYLKVLDSYGHQPILIDELEGDDELLASLLSTHFSSCGPVKYYYVVVSIHIHSC